MVDIVKCGAGAGVFTEVPVDRGRALCSFIILFLFNESGPATPRLLGVRVPTGLSSAGKAQAMVRGSDLPEEDITRIDQRWLPEGSAGVSQQTYNSSSAPFTWKMPSPTHTVSDLRFEGRLAVFVLSFCASFLYTHTYLSIILTITIHAPWLHFKRKCFNPFNIHINWLLTSESLIKALDCSSRAAYWWRANH